MSFSVLREDAGKDLQVKFKIVVAAEEVDKKRDAKIKEWGKKVRLDGFRPGKVPEREMRRRFEKAAHGEVLNEFIQESFDYALKSEKVEPVNQPKIDIVSDKVRENLEYTAVFERQPEVELADLASLTLKRPVSELSKDAIDKGILAARESVCTFSQVERAAQTGDKALIDFQGFINGELFPGGSAQGHTLVLGKSQMMPEFEAAILGKMAGDTVEFPVVFPESYHAKELAGKEVQFVVKLNMLEEPVLPELNAELFADLGCEPATQEVFEKQVKEPLIVEMNKQLDVLTRDRVFELLLGNHKFMVPESQLEVELSRLEAAAKKNGQEIDVKKQKKLQQQANDNVKLMFILQDIIKSNQIVVDDSLVDAEIESFAVGYQDKAEFCNWFKQDPQRVENARSQVLEQQAIDWIISKVAVKEEKIAYDKIAKLLDKE